MMSTTRIPGMDVVGVIEKPGPGVTGFKAGDAVFSMIGRGVPGLNGAYAEFTLALADNVVAKPANLSYAEAAGLGTIGMTAVRIVTRVGVATGQRVLATGVAGGVGSAAAQIVGARGAHVIDTVGGDTAVRSLKTLRKGGTFGTVADRMDAAQCSAAGVTCAGGGPPGPGDASEGDVLREIAGLAAAGKFTVHIDRTFPLARAADAQEFNREGHTEGKVILVVDAAHATGR